MKFPGGGNYTQILQLMTKASGLMQSPNDNVNNMNTYTAETNKIIVWRVTEGLELEADNLVWKTKASAVCK